MCVYIYIYIYTHSLSQAIIVGMMLGGRLGVVTRLPAEPPLS